VCVEGVEVRIVVGGGGKVVDEGCKFCGAGGVVVVEVEVSEVRS
jgi:hypothetical protein